MVALRYVNIAPNASDAPQNLTNSITPSTNRNFTINAGKTGTIDVASALTTLTMSGGSAATSGQLIKAGLGTLVLSGPNLHTGGTTVSAGTLLVINPGSLAAGAVTVASGAALGGDGTIGGSVSVASGGTLSPGNLGVGTLTVGGLTLNNGGIVNFEFERHERSDFRYQRQWINLKWRKHKSVQRRHDGRVCHQRHLHVD